MSAGGFLGRLPALSALCLGAGKGQVLALSQSHLWPCLLHPCCASVRCRHSFPGSVLLRAPVTPCAGHGSALEIQGSARLKRGLPAYVLLSGLSPWGLLNVGSAALVWKCPSAWWLLQLLLYPAEHQHIGPSLPEPRKPNRPAC